MVDVVDGVGVHAYWGKNGTNVDSAIKVVKYYTNKTKKPVYVTESSNNGVMSDTNKANQYIDFWRKLDKIDNVHGVTYFISSASNPQFKDETWKGTRIAELVAKR